MFDTALKSAERCDARLSRQRASGAARVGLVSSHGQSRLTQLHQSGCAKAFLPRVPRTPEVVFLNTAGGVTGGDRLDFSVSVGPGAKVTATTQTAERAYASAGGAARAHVALEVGADASLDWLPQETILFENSQLRRTTDAALNGNARLLLCETLVLGRAAMGERLRQAEVFDRRRIWRDGVPIFIDAVSLDSGALLTGAAGLGDAQAVAMIALLAPGAEDAVGPLRQVLADHSDVAHGASGWDGKCVVRLRARSAWPLRKALAAALRHLRGGALPSVWQS